MHVAGEASWWRAIKTGTESITGGIAFCANANLIIEASSEQLRPTEERRDSSHGGRTHVQEEETWRWSLRETFTSLSHTLDC